MVVLPVENESAASIDRMDWARSYAKLTGAFQRYRQAIVEALPVRRGQVVLDVGSRDRAVLRPAAGKGGPAGRCRRH
jgi:hypothetical protein